MYIKEAVVRRFQDLCRERGIKYNELATQSGVTPSTVYSMMDERRQGISIVTIKSSVTGSASPSRNFSHRPSLRSWSRKFIEIPAPLPFHQHTKVRRPP